MTALRITSLIGIAALGAAPISAQRAIVAPRIVHVEGNAVRVMTFGLDGRSAGQPVFVLQAGAGSSIEGWDPLFMLEIAEWAPVVAYDRPGLGSSTFDRQDPTVEHVADHLNALLAVLGVEPPYILIGHSWGGPLILHHAARYPDDVVGLVYIDPSDPHRERLPTDSTERSSALVAIDSIMSQRYVAPGRRAEMRVLVDYWLTPPQERPIPPNPDVPTAVVLGTYVGDVPEAERPARDALQQERVEGIRKWFGDVGPLHWIVAPHAGHFVQQGDPPLVAAAVRQVLNWVEAARDPR